MDTGWIEFLIGVAFFVGLYFVPRVSAIILFMLLLDRIGYLHFFGGISSGELILNRAAATVFTIQVLLLDVYAWLVKKMGEEHLFGNPKLELPSCSEKMFDDAESDS